MKTTIIVGLVLGISTLGFSINKISPELADRIRKLSENEKVTIVINLHESEHISFSDRMTRADKLHIIKDDNESNSRSIREFFASADPSSVEYVEYFWICHGLIATVSKEIIPQLSDRDDVQLIELSQNMQLIDDENRQIGYQVDEVGWNLDQINVPQVWNLGFTGEGVIIGFMDSGVTPNHPALISSWSGLWFDASGQYPQPNDIIGHGTHMSGIAVGGDGSGSFLHDTGVAPDAQFAMAKVSMDGFISNQYLFAGYQWYASLLDEGVDIRIISISLGTLWQSLSHWNAILTMRELGFIPVFAIGNTSGSVSCPASYPTVFGIGATDHTDHLWYNSGQGPAPDNNPWNNTIFWEKPDWDLIKPDLCAPGVDIPTTETGNGYCISTGTSPATPHIAGAIALMLQKNPTLTFNEIYNILLDNALHLGFPSPNNDYGWGRVNALAAINAVSPPTNEYITQIGYDFSETPNPGVTVDFSIGLKSYHFDAAGVSATIATSNPQITVINNTADFGTIPANAIVTNNANPFVFSVSNSCLQGQQETFDIQITTDSGNVFMKEFHFTLGEPELVTLFYDDFENGLDNWTVQEHWQLSTETSHSPTHCVKNQFITHPNPGESVWERLLLTEPIDLSECHYKAELRFWCTYNYTTMDQGLMVIATTDFDDDFADHAILELAVTSNQPSEFVEMTADLSEFAGEDSVFLRFSAGYSFTFDWHFALDDVEILADQLGDLNVELPPITANTYQLSNYPNPFNPTTTISFYLEYPKEVTITIYDISGRKVKSLMNGQLSSGKHSVQWDGLDDNGKLASSGLYFCSMNTGAKTEVQKMLLLR